MRADLTPETERRSGKQKAGSDDGDISRALDVLKVVEPDSVDDPILVLPRVEGPAA